MQKIKRINIGSTLAVVTLLFAPIAVYAHDGIRTVDTPSSSGSEVRSTSTSPTETHTAETATPKPPETEISHDGTAETHTTTGNDELHKKGDSLLADMEKNHPDGKKHTPEEQKKVCEAHKEGLNNKFSHIVANSDRLQSRIDGIFSNAVGFQSTDNLQVTGFDTLVAAAKTAQTNSVASIATLKSIVPSVDCNNVSVANDVATFKVGAQQTRDNLKAYKVAVRAILQALETTTITTEGSTHQ